LGFRLVQNGSGANEFAACVQIVPKEVSSVDLSDSVDPRINKLCASMRG